MEANQIFLLFARIRGERLNHFSEMFLGFLKNIIRLKEKSANEDFYKVFQIGSSVPQKFSEVALNKPRKIKSYVFKSLFFWTIKLISIFAILIAVFALKYTFLITKFFDLYNSFFFFKSHIYFNIYRTSTTNILSKHLIELQSNGSFTSTNETNSLFKRFLSKTIDNYHNSSIPFAFKASQKFSVFITKIEQGDFSDLSANFKTFLDDPISESFLKNGFYSANSQIKIKLKSLESLFLNTAFYSNKDQKENLINELSILEIIDFPYFNQLEFVDG